MKKTWIMFILLLFMTSITLLSSCVGVEMISVETKDTGTETSTSKPVFTSTITMTPTLTVTPTLTPTATATSVPTMTPTQSPTVTVTNVPLPVDWDFDKVAQSWIKTGRWQDVAGVSAQILKEYIIDGKYPELELPDDVGNKYDYKGRMLIICNFYKDSVSAQEYCSTYYDLDTFEEVQTFFLGGPYCYAIVDSDS